MCENILLFSAVTQNAITEKTAPPTKKSEENGPLTKKSEENGPLTKKSEENGPLTKKSEENGPLMKKSEENGPPTKKSEENGPLIKKSRQKIFYGPELPLKSPPMNGQTSSNAEGTYVRMWTTDTPYVGTYMDMKLSLFPFAYKYQKQ